MVNTCTRVSLRQRAIKNDRISLYLDFVKPSTYGNKANPSSCNSLYDDVGIIMKTTKVLLLFILKTTALY